VYVERATVENVPGVVGSRTDEYVIVKMRFTVSIETVGKTHDAPPTSAFVSFLTSASVPHDQCTLLEILH
jgi:hypothetical protein